PLSFVEDPTRIMRAVRFETRFDFRMDADTERFAREAVRAGYLMGLSPRRLRDELELILRDERPVRALVRMKEISALSAYHPRLLATARAKSYLFRVRLELENPEAILPGVIPDAVKTWLIALAATLGPGDDEAFLARVEMQGRPAQRLAERARAVEDLSRSLAHRARKTRSELARELGGWEPEALFALVARHDSPRVVERVREYWTTIRSAAPPVRGEDLMALGVARGRALGDALAALREVYLDGEATTREELIALARERFAPKATPAKAKKTHAK
ncbi:hypothetical protein K8I61_11435, partial [bacterium]|nr:hypothetical protein [bacterium]